MTIGTMLRAGIFGVACAMAFAVLPASAEETQDSTASSAPAATPSTTAPKAKAKHSEHKASEGKQVAKEADSESKQKRGQFNSEAEAKAHCKSEVVWIDRDHFSHYAGSREYGKQPGVFACENG